jgi:hypothetical protein
VAACKYKFPYVTTASELAEGMSVRMDLSFAKDEGLDIKVLVGSFCSCSIRHVKRLQNYAAHHVGESSNLSFVLGKQFVSTLCS